MWCAAAALPCWRCCSPPLPPLLLPSLLPPILRYVNSIFMLKRVACEIRLLHQLAADRAGGTAMLPHTLLPIHEVFQTSSHFYYIMDRYGRDVFDFMKLGRPRPVCVLPIEPRPTLQSSVQSSVLSSVPPAHAHIWLPHHLPFFVPGNHSVAGVGRENAVLIFASVCDGLASLHSLGYAHRDIKSENVLVEYETKMCGEEGEPGERVTGWCGVGLRTVTATTGSALLTVGRPRFSPVPACRFVAVPDRRPDHRRPPGP